MHRELHFYEPLSIEQKKRIMSLLAHQQYNVKMETVLFTFYVMFGTGNWIEVASLCNNDPNQFN